MIKKNLFTLFLFVISLINTGTLQAQITNFQCEHLINPIGIDVLSPRFSWKMNSGEKGDKQSAYQIQVGIDSIALANGKDSGVVWDSGKKKSDQMLVRYNGEKLHDFTRYYWTVACWDKKGKKIKSPVISSFETAGIYPYSWPCHWISDGNSMDYKPAPYFRKTVQVNKNIQSARAYVAAAGLYELYINGEKVDNRLLDPMYTRFDRRNLYATLDITGYLNEGENTIGVLLGNGWYNHQSTAVWDFHKAPWRDRPKFMAEIKVMYANGSTDSFITDEKWKTTDSPVIFNSIYTAEHYDARKEIQGWNTNKTDISGWKNAVICQAPSSNIRSQQLHPIRVTDTFQPAKIDYRSDSCVIYHFPKNIAGITKVEIQGTEGTILRIKHGERLKDDGSLEMTNIDYHYRPTDDSDPFQTDILILSGKKDIFSPKFNYKGFQYVEIKSSQPINWNDLKLTALELHSDIPAVGDIHSSNPIINKIWAATNNSYLSNLFGYPTDCPQREKNGWTGDAHIAIETGLYNFDGITVYEKWLADFRDEQKDDGTLPNIVPTSGWGYNWANGPDWTSAVAIIPWEIYRFYGDTTLLSQMYGNIKRYVDLITSKSPEYTTDWGLGDWVPVKTKSNKELTSSLYYYTDVLILAKAARLFGKTPDATYYFDLSEKIKQAINRKFLNKETGIYSLGSQTELAAPLFWGIVPEELKAKVADNLYKKVEATGFHLDVGLLGSKVLLDALTQNGYAEAAYKIASQETYPSWGWWMVNGMTTLSENWRLDVLRDASLNHIMFGEIGAWLYKGLGGIYPDENYPGFKQIILKPNFVEGLEHFKAQHESPYGNIISYWERKGNNIQYEVTIPANCTAILYLPENVKTKNKIVKLESGHHKMRW